MHDLIKVLLLTCTQWIIIYYIDKRRMKNKIVIREQEIEDTVKLISTISYELNETNRT